MIRHNDFSFIVMPPVAHAVRTALTLPSGGGFPKISRMSNAVSPSIDWEQLDMIADGYTPDFVEIYREFEVDLPRILGEIRTGLESDDAVAVSRAAHQAKGSAANFGFNGFSALMAEIETEAKAGDLTGVSARLDVAARLFEESVAVVKAERGV